MKVILAREACRSVTCKQKIQEEIKTSAVVHKHDHAVASINCIHYHVCYTHYYVVGEKALIYNLAICKLQSAAS